MSLGENCLKTVVVYPQFMQLPVAVHVDYDKRTVSPLTVSDLMNDIVELNKLLFEMKNKSKKKQKRAVKQEIRRIE